MFAIVFKIWFMIAVLPFLIFLESSKIFANFLKKRNIYLHWDVYHSFLVILFIIYIFLWAKGYR
jgi:hypothetical protein